MTNMLIVLFFLEGGGSIRPAATSQIMEFNSLTTYESAKAGVVDSVSKIKDIASFSISCYKK